MSGEIELYQLSPLAITGDITDDEKRKLVDLLAVWDKKYYRNKLRERYYDGKNGLKDLGVSIPPQLKTVETVIGWPAKAVDMLANRCIFEGFAATDDNVQRVLRQIVKRNNFNLLVDMLIQSELMHSCSFVTVSKGDRSVGEPEVMLNAYDALTAAALWDWRHKRISCGITVVDAFVEPTTGLTIPTAVNLYTDDAVVMMEKHGDPYGPGPWTAERVPNDFGRPMMEPLVYRPSLTRPFGKSRISRAVMSITDSAVRTALRTEVSSEFFTSPQRYLLGADEDVFGTDDDEIRANKVKSYLGSIMAITTNQEGEIPQYGQLPQLTMQPHIDYMRDLAARFAGETSVPISSLGVIHDNPASAEAMYNATDDLIQEAEGVCKKNGAALKTVAQMALSLALDVKYSEILDTDVDLETQWASPARVSVAARTDSTMKQVDKFPWMVDSDVILEELGYSADRIQRLKVARENYNLRTAQQEAFSTQSTLSMYKIKSILESYKNGNLSYPNALDLLGRIGIYGDEASTLLENIDAGVPTEEAVNTVAAATQQPALQEGGGQQQAFDSGQEPPTENPEEPGTVEQAAEGKAGPEPVDESVAAMLELLKRYQRGGVSADQVVSALVDGGVDEDVARRVVGEIDYGTDPETLLRRAGILT